MCDCTLCDAFTNSPPPTGLLCSAPQDPPPLAHGAGARQIPLLHLVYQLSLELAKLEPRKARKTWLKPNILKSGAHSYHFKKFDLAKVEREAQQILGMLFAQRVRFLPVLAQVSRAQQIEMVTAAVQLLTSGATLPENLAQLGLTFARLDGTLQDPLEIYRCQRKLAQLQQRSKDLEALSDFNTLYGILKEHYSLLLKEKSRLVHLLQLPDLFFAELRRFHSHLLYRKQQLELWLKTSGPMPPDAEQEYAQVEHHLAWLERLPEEHYRQILNQKQAEIETEMKSLAGMLQDVGHPGWKLALQRNQAIATDVLFESAAAELELAQLKEAAQQDAQALQAIFQSTCYEGDAALQDENYPPEHSELLERLRVPLAASAVARQIFLYLDPKLKYHTDHRLRCRLATLLSNQNFLSLFATANQARLLQPGPFAHMGAFIINSLVPGSYDGRHRELVQSEIEEIAEALGETGEGFQITCHSCGAEAFGNADDPVWVRDHNPPSALAEMTVPNLLPELRMSLYVSTKNTPSQILLPHCLRCSTAQSSITAKARDLLKNGQATDWNSLMIALGVDGARDFLRLVCSPGIGWYYRTGGDRHVSQILGLDPNGAPTQAPTPNQHPGGSAWADWLIKLLAAHQVPGSALVTTGKVGSFAGLDEDLLKKMGQTWGCHTCVTPAPQTNPFEGMSWIADHQPPTALAARGLMELPQIVLPHCHRCSSNQSTAVSRLCRVFDACFDSYPETGTERWVEYWIGKIRAAGFDDLAG